jgi:glycosyltransferase involved in cell wall biosynthesis
VIDHRRPLRVINVHDFESGWPWIAQLYRGPPELQWRSIDTQRSRLIRKLPGPHLGRVRAALQVRMTIAHHEADLVVSHGPYTSYYVEALGRAGNRDVPHVAFAFNFTDIPQGHRLRAMQRVFPSIDRLVVYSQMERSLYAERFGVPIDRFCFMRWGVAPPLARPGPRTIDKPYVAALGGEARDFATLCDAARRLPSIAFVLIVRPSSLDGIAVPDNVKVHVNLPFADAWSLVWHAEAALIPLRSEQTPNGLVTLVGGMHLGKAQVVTASAGISDYVEDGKTALLVPARDGAAFAAAIERLFDNPALRTEIGERARAFANVHCSEAVTVEGFRQLLVELTGVL